MQDNSVQVMAEVALGLCMAFFAIMVVALVSVSTPVASEQQATAIESSVLLDQSHDASGSDGHEKMQESFVFFYKGRFFNEQMDEVIPSNLSLDKQWVLVLPAKMSLSDSLATQRKLSINNAGIAQMNVEWERAFEQRIGK